MKKKIIKDFKIIQELHSIYQETKRKAMRTLGVLFIVISFILAVCLRTSWGAERDISFIVFSIILFIVGTILIVWRLDE